MVYGQEKNLKFYIFLIFSISVYINQLKNIQKKQARLP